MSDSNYQWLQLTAQYCVLQMTNSQRKEKAIQGQVKKKREPVVWMKDYGEKLSFASSLHN